ncbi:MAG TPA: GNAT family N-acetyltransferase [Streptosporangiaceae bacterium]|nr:GNAT family N-acetyltransferase [Streptosporangiaceae bacterium]
MLIERFDPEADEGLTRAWYALYAAGAPVDEPGGPPMSPGVWMGLKAHGWCAEPRENWLAFDEPGGALLGGYSLELPDRENRGRTLVTLLVDPGRRRAGIGTALLRHTRARAAGLGRRTMTSLVLEGTPGDGFARAQGASIDLIEARRTLDVTAIPAGHLARLRASAEGPAAGYTLTVWDGPTPGQWLEPVARLNEALADAPHGDEEEPQVWDADRVRLVDQLSVDRGLRRYSVAAVGPGTGDLAALTQLSVEEPTPEWGHQELTAVARPHRGHRLGLLTKLAMLELVAAREPQVAFIETWNGEANAHMVAINEMLGFRQTGRVIAWLLPTGAEQAAGGPASTALGAAAGQS